MQILSLTTRGVNKLESLISSLQHLRLSLKESKAYLCLLRKSRISGYELSRNAGIPPSKIYKPLNKLLTKGIISPIRSDQGLRYLALEPLEILEHHQNPYKHNLEGLKRQLIKTRQNPDAFNPFLWQLSERDNILLKIREIIKKSRKVIYLV